MLAQLAANENFAINSFSMSLPPAAICTEVNADMEEKVVFDGGQNLFVEAQLKDFLWRTIADADVGNGTPVVDALATALLVDLRLSGAGKAGLDRLLALTGEEQIDLAVDLIYALETKGAEFELPLGSRVKTENPGGFKISREMWMLDADRPGLHPIETLSRDPHGRNLVLLLHHIDRMTRRLACRRIGLPKAFYINEGEPRHLLQFAPFGPAGDVVLQRLAYGTGADRFCSALPEQIKAFAKDIVLDMRALWTHRKVIAARANVVRREMQAAVSDKDGVELSKVTVDLNYQRDDAEFDLYVEFSGLDDSLRPGVLLDFIPASENFVHSRGRAWKHEWNTELSGKLKDQGADGQIDGLAKALVRMAPDGGKALLARLGNELDITVALPSKTTPVYATLYWDGGTIKGEVTIPGHVDSFGRYMEIRGLDLPETVLTAATGRPLNALVELPFDCSATILEISDCTTAKRVELELGLEVVDTATGRIWPGETID